MMHQPTIDGSSIFRLLIIDIKDWSKEASTQRLFDESNIHRITTLDLVNASFLEKARKKCRAAAFERLFNVSKLSFRSGISDRKLQWMIWVAEETVHAATKRWGEKDWVNNWKIQLRWKSETRIFILLTNPVKSDIFTFCGNVKIQVVNKPFFFDV